MRYYKIFFMFVVPFLFVMFAGCNKSDDDDAAENFQEDVNKVEYEQLVENFNGHELIEKGEVTYPVFKDYPELNNLVSDKILKSKASFLEQVNEVSQLYADADNGETPKTEFILSYSNIISSENYIGFMLSAYMYVGGAHGITESIAINFDIKNHKELSLEDVLKPLCENWLERLSNASKEALLELMKTKGEAFSDEELIKEGTSADPSNFKNFNIKDDNIVIIFDQYQVAPYASGMPEISIPLSLFK